MTTDAEIEAAARAAYESEYDPGDLPWGELSPGEQLSYRHMAKAALAAAERTRWQDFGILAEIIAHYTKHGTRDGWALPDDFSSLCYEDRTGDAVFWVDIERDTVKVLWRPPGATESKVLRFKAPLEEPNGHKS